MAKLMWICGILLGASSLALGIVLFASGVRPGGIDIQTAAILLVGGVLALGLGSVIDGQAAALNRPPSSETVSPAKTPIPEFDPRGSKTAASPEASAAAAAVSVEDEVSRPTRDTIQALEQARQRIEQSFDDRSSPANFIRMPQEPDSSALAVVGESVVKEQAPAEEETASEEEAAAEDEVMEEGQLYVVEERIIRRHPARILSDGTVEAETAEGWMRFENLEHLDEYLDAMEPARG
ncbi:MAG: hypothetical protein IOC82_14340 [Aestuariivirga sp.]|uniref:hypothetical protein n=1 Tax=Aestuariivirga sp. TaxID=2650926 RepID=UPI0025C5CD1E|nr:hypothetical protein [Aestuariivirga sp.]MCA3562199.1 hypothetical protein [Aestuariivirga sp.]